MTGIADNYKSAAGCLLVVVAASILFRPGSSQSVAHGTSVGVQSSSRLLEEAVTYDKASRDSENNLVALMYANYATAYLRLVDFSKVASKTNFPDLEKRVEARQQELIASLSNDVVHSVQAPVVA
jgi:hypothetical protein